MGGQKELKNTPVYTILNGRGEIILANSFSKLIDKEKKTFLIENLYLLILINSLGFQLERNLSPANINPV